MTADEEISPEEPPALERVHEEEFEDLNSASNNSPRGIWSDGEVMYVADESDGRVYTYNMPDALNARLASLTLSGLDIGEFNSLRTEYVAAPGEDVSSTRVRFERQHRGATVAIAPEPAGGDAANGYEVELTVTSADGLRTRVYRVRLGASEELALEAGFTAIEWPGLDGVTVAEALADVADTVVAVYAWDETPGTWLAYCAGLDDVPGLNALESLEQSRTYWVAATTSLTWSVPVP